MKRAPWQKCKRKNGHMLLRVAMAVLLLAVALVLLAEWKLAPVVSSVALQQAHSRVLTEITRTVGEQVQRQEETLSYRQLMHIERDDDGRVALLVPDTMRLNAFMAEVVTGMEETLTELTRQKVSLPMGALTGSALLADWGPELRYGFRFQGVPEVEVKDEFLSAGINQVQHRIYLDVAVELRIIVPFSHRTDTVTATVLLSEGIIVGYTPDTYLNLTPSFGQEE